MGVFVIVLVSLVVCLVGSLVNSRCKIWFVVMVVGVVFCVFVFFIINMNLFLLCEVLVVSYVGVFVVGSMMICLNSLVNLWLIRRCWVGKCFVNVVSVVLM